MFFKKELQAAEAQELLFNFVQKTFGRVSESLQSVAVEPLVEPDARKAVLWLADNQEKGVEHLQPQVQKLIYEMFTQSLFLLSGIAKADPRKQMPEKVSRSATDSEKTALLIRNVVARSPIDHVLPNR